MEWNVSQQNKKNHTEKQEKNKERMGRVHGRNFQNFRLLRLISNSAVHASTKQHKKEFTVLVTVLIEKGKQKFCG